jgi:hypothetical protein
MKIFNNKFLIPLIILVFLGSLGCINEMEHKGNWSSPASSENYLLVPSDDGYIYKFSKDSGQIENGWKYPQSESSLGSFYGESLITNNILYGSSYGNGDGKKCQNRECTASIFAVDIKTGKSIWMDEILNVDGSVVGGVNLHDDILYFATVENNTQDGVGSYLYAIDATSDYGKNLSELTQRILWKVSIEGKIYGQPTIDYEQNLLILGTLNGELLIIDLEDSTDFTNPQNRLIERYSTDYPIISPVVKVSNLDSDADSSDYCFGNIKGQFKCFSFSASQNSFLESNKEFWGDIQLNGWVWSDIERVGNNLYLTTLSGWAYKFYVDPQLKSISIEWEQELNYDGKPVGGVATYTHRNQDFLAIPFDKDKVVILDALNGIVVGEFPLKDGVLSNPVVSDGLLYVIDKENRFQSFSLGDRSLIKCFDLEDMKGCN